MNDTFEQSHVSQSLFDTPIARVGTSSLKWDKYKGKEILPMWVADMDFAVAPPIQAALEQRLKHPLYGYTVASDEIKVAIANHLANEYSWKIEHEWLVFLPGVVNGLAMSCRAYCADDDHVMVNPPIYHHFYDSHEGKRQSLTKVPLHKVNNRWTYDVDAMRAACGEKVSMIMMCSPHNPTGTVFTKDELTDVGNMCAEHNMMIISDEIHCDLVIDGKSRHVPTAVACPEHADRIVTLMSASKTWNLAGLNVSFAIIPNAKRRAQFIETCQSVIPMPVPFALVATEAAYSKGGPWRKALLQYLKRNYDKIDEALRDIPGLKLQPLQATYLAWIDATDLNLSNTQGFFEEHGVGLSSGEQFGQSQFIRLNFACPASVLDEGLLRMRQAVATIA